MVPVWILVFWGLATARALPGVAFAVASIAATFAAFVADRWLMITPATRRWIPLVGVALIVVWIFVLPFLYAGGR